MNPTTSTETITQTERLVLLSSILKEGALVKENNSNIEVIPRDNQAGKAVSSWLCECAEMGLNIETATIKALTHWFRRQLQPQERQAYHRHQAVQ